MEWLVGDEDYVTGRGMEELPAGPSLAVMLDCVAMGEEPGVGMDQAALLESMRAGQKMESWATARKLQAIVEFVSRLDQEGSGRGEFLFAEVSLALGLTKNAAAELVFVADRLVCRLPSTFAALKCGRISFPQAKIIAVGTANLREDLAAAVEAAVLQKAHRQTTGQLRAAVKTAIKTVDPEAFQEKLEEEVRERRVEVWENQFGTADLVGRNLPVTITDAAFNRLGALARSLRDDGDPRTMDQLRADLFVALLLGHPTAPEGSAAPEPGPGPGSDSESEPPAGPGPGPGPGTDADGGFHPDDGEAPAGQGAGPGQRERPAESGTGSDRGSRIGHGEGSAGRGPGPREPAAEPGRDAAQDSTPGDSETAAGRGAEDGQWPAGHDPQDPGPAEPVEDEPPEKETSPWEDDGPIEHHPPSRPAPDRAGPPVPADLSDTTTVPVYQGRASAKTQAEADQARQARQDATAVADLAHTEIPELINTWLGGHPRPSPERCRLAISEAARIFTTRHRTDPGASRTCTFTVNHDGTLTHGAGLYRPPAAMRRLIDHRDGTCVFPTCRQPASRADCDHTLAYHSGGPTCPCNLALLCRGHHRAKQSHGWALHHLFPGVLLWVTPTGSWHIVGPEP